MKLQEIANDKPLLNKWWIVFFEQEAGTESVRFVHGVAYDEKPTIHDIKALYEELRTDPDFAMSEEYLRSLEVKMYEPDPDDEDYRAFEAWING